MTFFFIVSAGFMQLPEQGDKKAAECPWRYPGMLLFWTCAELAFKASSGLHHLLISVEHGGMHHQPARYWSQVDPFWTAAKWNMKMSAGFSITEKLTHSYVSLSEITCTLRLCARLILSIYHPTDVTGCRVYYQIQWANYVPIKSHHNNLQEACLRVWCNIRLNNYSWMLWSFSSRLFSEWMCSRLFSL